MTHLKLVADLVAAVITNGDRYPQFLLHKQCAPFATGTSYRPGGARRYAPPADGSSTRGGSTSVVLDNIQQLMCTD